MVITWYGQSCFKIQSGDTVIAIDPYGKETGLTPPRFRADIVLVTHAHFDHANTETLSGEPFVASGPGEYEVKDVYIKGIASWHDASQGKERGMNTIYKIACEGLSLVHMGDFGESELRDETLEEIGETDILMAPVGGVYTVDAPQAAKIVRKIEPRFVIPMHYKIPGLKINLAGAETFLKETGSKAAAQEKFTVKKKDVGEDGKTEVVLLAPAG